VTAVPKRLIEVDFPIKRISEHARHDKKVRHGHISTLHVWWARRPLAACRAVVCAALWPDPADKDCPQIFREAAREQMKHWASHNLNLLSAHSIERFVAIQRNPAILDSNDEVRASLLDFIAEFANWNNASVPEYVETSRTLTQKAHIALNGDDGSRPLVFDPFAGGGAIPLEASRIGAEAFAGDLNPVAVLLNKMILNFIPKYGIQFATAIRECGEKAKKEAEAQLSKFYPIDDDGGVPVAFLWARTIISEAPSQSRIPVEVPLLRSMWLSKRKGFLRALRWARDSEGQVLSEIGIVKREEQSLEVLRPILEIFEPSRFDEVEQGSVKGGAATCPITGFTTKASRVKEQLKTQKGGAECARLYAVYVDKPSGRSFRLAQQADVSTYVEATAFSKLTRERNPEAFPTEIINPIRPFNNTRGLSAVTRVGCSTFSDLYNSRQALSIYTFSKIIARNDLSHFSGDKQLVDALKTALAFGVSRLVSQNTSMSRWDASRLTIKGAFSKQALAVVWDFAEANPFSGATADWDGSIEWITKFVEANSLLQVEGTAVQASATNIPLPSDSASALITDPPYFAAIPYADLSDFFYVWLKRILGTTYPDLFQSSLTPKTDELIVTNAQKGPNDRKKDETFFREEMTKALSAARDVVRPDGIGVIVYAEGTTAGWEAILNAIIDSQWIVTSSWPLDTEMESRTQAQGSASLQSSIHIVCRPRTAELVGDWRDVLLELPGRIHLWMSRLSKEGVVGADAIFSCLGPALEIFSRYSHVEKANGNKVSLGEYLVYVWAAVSKEALGLIFEGADVAGFEEDARLTAMWLWTLSAGTAGSSESEENEEEEESDEEGAAEKSPKVTKGFILEFDAARKIAQGLGAHLEVLTSLVEVRGDVARLLPVAERTRKLFGKEEDDVASAKRKRKLPQLELGFVDELKEVEEAGAWGAKGAPPLGSTVLDRVHQSMILFAAGRGEALRRFLVAEGAGKDERYWRLAQVLSYLYPKASDEKRWIDGVLARKKGLGL
jgi:putative DNA methylase